MQLRTAEQFTDFVREAEPRLRRAYAGVLGPDLAADAVAEALAWAWEHRTEVGAMSNPVGYLFRVGQSKTRRRKRPELPPPEPGRLPRIEPGLIDGLLRLPDRQRAAVWLVHACEWSHAEVGEALDIGSSTVATHTSRGLEALRRFLGEADHV